MLRVEADRATFDRTVVLPSSSEGHDLTTELYLDARSGSARYLLGDRKELFEIDDAGKLAHLRSDIQSATAP